MKIRKNSQNVKNWIYEMHEIDKQQTNNCENYNKCNLLR